MTVLSQWREAGRWWDGEAEREFVRYLDEKGILREQSLEFRVQSLDSPPLNSKLQTPNSRYGGHTVDYDVMRMEERQRVKNVVTYLSQNGATMPKERYAQLHSLSALSFGRSSIHPEQLAALAFVRGASAVAITDWFSLAGVVAFCGAAKQLGVKPIIGASLEVASGGGLVLLARNHEGYRNLSRLITHCHQSQPRLFPLWDGFQFSVFSFQSLACLTGGHAGPVNRLLAHKEYGKAKAMLLELIEGFGKENVFVEIERTFTPWEVSANAVLLEMAKELGLTPIAGGTVCHAERKDFGAQDALLCVETLCEVEEIYGRKPTRHHSQPQTKPWPQRFINSERYFRSAQEMQELFEPQLLQNALALANEFPENPLPPQPNFPKFCDNPEVKLREVALKGAKKYYPNLSVEHKYRIQGELERICASGYTSHFLAIWEACEWARSEGILFSARGSAVDSAVSYCMGFSRIDAIRHGLHFDRFMPGDGSKKPDIDIDFEAARRDDVRNFFARRYGKEHVATVSAIATYQGRGIIRFVGKALMIPEETLAFFAKRLHGSVSGRKLMDGIENRPELRDSNIPAERFNILFELATVIDGLPRHMGTHASGVVITETPMCETVPVMESGREGVPIIQWDKYSAKKYFNKFDILCLRGHDVMARTQRQVRETKPSFNVDDIPHDDESVYREFRAGNLIGTPQSASPAMRQAHIRLRSENLHDISLVQAGIRPGVGGAVKINELIRRRRGTSPYSYPHPLFEAILGISYGIIVFQEQVDQLLQAFCGYTSGEAEDLRDNIHKRRAESFEETVKDEILERCIANGFSQAVSDHVYELVSGFKGYGFAQGHALAFADISIRCVYMQQNYPAEYFAALLSSQPAGYYGPGTIANEARLRGVPILPLDVNASEEEFAVQGTGIRVGWMQVHGLSGSAKERIAGSLHPWKGGGIGGALPFTSIFDFALRAKPDLDELENLILAGAFDALHPNRRALLWVLPEAAEFAHGKQATLIDAPEPAIPEDVLDFTEYERAVLERSMLSLDVKKHLMAFERERVIEKGGISCGAAQRTLKDRQKAIVVGHAMRLRFPPTSSGKRVVFFDLEDETGLLNVTCFDETYQKDGKTIICSPFVTLRGEAQERDGHMAFLAHRVFPYEPQIDKHGFALERKAVHAEDFIHG